MSDGLGRITAIVRERYETGAYGDCHFRVSAEVLRVMREQPPAPKREPWDSGGGAGDALLSIPIVPDDSLPDGWWHLVRRVYSTDPPFTSHDVIVEQGGIVPDLPQLEG
jgi:hypothetical protein